MRLVLMLSRSAVVAAVIGFVAFATPTPTSAFGNNRWVTRPGCGNNWVESAGNGSYAYARTAKGANNSCSGHMFAGLRITATGDVWVQDPYNAVVEADPYDLVGRHRGCQACSVTTS